MSISVVCTSCGKKYRLKDEREGKKFRCKGCEQVLIVTQSPQPATTKQTEAGDQSTKRRPKSSDDQPDRRRRKRKKKPVADPYAHGDDLYGSTLDRFDGDYGEDFPEDDNPYRAPSHQGSAARRRRGGRETPPLTMMQKLSSFDGRINRGTYWGLSIAIILVFLVLVSLIASAAAAFDVPILAGIAVLILAVPIIWISLALQVKRWHDRDKSGAWCFINLIPGIGGIWMFVECGCLAGTPGENTYGSEPE
jgi:uncharacterized membrane protein YhaH (DUF805 family)